MELGFESLNSRRWFRRLCCIFILMKTQALEYLNKILNQEISILQVTAVQQSILNFIFSLPH